MGTFNSGHPEKSIVARLMTFENQNPSVMIWRPTQSISGNWEAMGDGWCIEDTNPGRFLDRIGKLLDDNGNGLAADQGSAPGRD
jgi:hypothetical protein